MADSVAPHDAIAERAIIGAVLMDDSRFESVSNIPPAAFYRRAHAEIWDAFRELRRAGAAIDVLTVSSALAERGRLEDVGGATYLNDLTDGMPRGAHVQSYAEPIQRTFAQRRFLERLERAKTAALAGREAAALDLIRGLVLNADENDQDPLLEPIATVSERLAGEVEPADLVTDLLPGSGIALWAGHPRDGKSIAAHEACVGLTTGRKVFGRLSVPNVVPVAFFTEEDSARSIVRRFEAFAGGPIRSSRPPFFLSALKGSSLDEPRTQDRVIAETRTAGAGLVVIDPVRSLTTCADKGPAEFTPFAAYLRRLARETSAAILLIHHAVKPQPNDQRRGVHRASGGAIFSVSDAPVMFERVEDAEPLETVLTPTSWKHRNAPAPIRLRLEVRDGRVTALQAVDADVVACGDTRVLDAVRSSPGQTAYGVAERLGMRRADGPAALERLRLAGLVTPQISGRSTVWLPAL